MMMADTGSTPPDRDMDPVDVDNDKDGVVSAQAFVDAALEWMGAPYRHQGRAVHGADCAFMVEVGRRLGIPIAWVCDATNYVGPNGTLEGHLDEHLERALPGGRIVPGMIGLFWIPRNRHRQPGQQGYGRGPQHLALFVDVAGELGMLHTHNKMDGTGSVVRHRADARWLERMQCAYRVPGVEY